jgi:hypothetical protein
MNDDEIEDLYMSEWLQYAIVLLITAVSIAALAFLLGYLL